MRIAAVGVVVASGLALLLTFPVGQDRQSDSGSYSRSFSEKLSDVTDELAPRFYVYDADIHLNWRGYESFLLIEAIRGDLREGNLLGRGPGAELDLYFNKRVARGAEEYESTGAWFHDGFLAATFKFGVLGAVGVLWWLCATSFAWVRCCKVLPNANRLDRLVGPVFFALGIAFLGLPFDAIDSPAISVLIGWASTLKGKRNVGRSPSV